MALNLVFTGAAYWCFHPMAKIELKVHIQKGSWSYYTIVVYKKTWISVLPNLNFWTKAELPQQER